MPTSFQVKTYFKYWLECVDSHSLHSPFFFDFYTNVVKKDHAADNYLTFEKLRDKLLHNGTPILIEDLGAGAAKLRTSTYERPIKDIARQALSSSKYSRLYSRIISYYHCKKVLELGTSLGINALYLSSNAEAEVVTIEGSASIASVARSTFEFADARNINILEGDLAIVLPRHLVRAGKIDFVFMDANHRYGPTVEYFNQLLRHVHAQSILVIDDIHYTAEMEQAWDELRKHPLVYGSADLYRCGILFFDPSLNKQHVVLQF